jgi:hypothetical protein
MIKLTDILKEVKIKDPSIIPSLKQFIDKNWDTFSKLDYDDTIKVSATGDYEDFNQNMVNYLKSIKQFEHNGINIHYVQSKDEIWIENTDINFGNY